MGLTVRLQKKTRCIDCCAVAIDRTTRVNRTVTDSNWLIDVAFFLYLSLFVYFHSTMHPFPLGVRFVWIFHTFPLRFLSLLITPHGPEIRPCSWSFSIALIGVLEFCLKSETIRLFRRLFQTSERLELFWNVELFRCRDLCEIFISSWASSPSRRIWEMGNTTFRLHQWNPEWSFEKMV